MIGKHGQLLDAPSRGCLFGQSSLQSAGVLSAALFGSTWQVEVYGPLKHQGARKFQQARMSVRCRPGRDVGRSGPQRFPEKQEENQTVLFH